MTTYQRNGTATPSFCSALLDNGGVPVNELMDFDIRWTANSMYSGRLWLVQFQALADLAYS